MLYPELRKGEMDRSDYLQLRAEQLDLALGVQHWDTRPLPELRAMQATLSRQLERAEALLAASRAAAARGETEQQAHVRGSRRMLIYLRALCYLREHGIAPTWPRGSAPLAPGIRSAVPELPEG